MSSYIPKDIVESKKQGFSSPDASWFKGESIRFVESKLLNQHSPIYEPLDYASVKVLLDQHLRGEQNRRLLIWSLLNIEAWIGTYL